MPSAGIRPTSGGLWFVSAVHDERLIDRTLEAVAVVVAELAR